MEVSRFGDWLLAAFNKRDEAALLLSSLLLGLGDFFLVVALFFLVIAFLLLFLEGNESAFLLSKCGFLDDVLDVGDVDVETLCDDASRRQGRCPTYASRR